MEIARGRKARGRAGGTEKSRGTAAARTRVATADPDVEFRLTDAVKTDEIKTRDVIHQPATAAGVAVVLPSGTVVAVTKSVMVADLPRQPEGVPNYLEKWTTGRGAAMEGLALGWLTVGSGRRNRGAIEVAVAVGQAPKAVAEMSTSTGIGTREGVGVRKGGTAGSGAAATNGQGDVKFSGVLVYVHVASRQLLVTLTHVPLGGIWQLGLYIFCEDEGSLIDPFFVGGRRLWSHREVYGSSDGGAVDLRDKMCGSAAGQLAGLL